MEKEEAGYSASGGLGFRGAQVKGGFCREDRASSITLTHQDPKSSSDEP